MRLAAPAPALGVGVAVATAAAAIAARHATVADSSPVMPRGIWSSVWIWSVVAALIFYGLAVAVMRARTSLLLVLALSVAVQALPLLSPLLLSKDAYAYWSQTRVLLVHGANPYRYAPSQFPRDPSFPYVSESWRTHTSNYGPVWELEATIPAAVAGTSARAASVAYRVLALAGVLAAVALVACRTRSGAATAFVGWNPLVALHFTGGGHNDAWLGVLLVLAAVSAGAAARGGALVAATLFKGFPILLVPLELARTRLRPGRSFWLGLTAAAVALGAASFALFGTAWITSGIRGANIESGLGAVHWLQQLGLRYRDAVVVSSGAFAVVYLLLLVHAWRRGRTRLSLATSALCITAAQLRPWYAIWPVVLAGAEEDALAAVAAFALTAYLLLADAVSF